MSDNGIIRVERHNKDYFVAKNEPFQDSSLSFAARGILAYLLSKPNDWTVRNHDLYNQSPAGRKHIDRCLRELKEAGYLRRFREQDELGHWYWVSKVYELKQLNPDYNPDSHKPERSLLERSEKERSEKERSEKGLYTKVPDSLSTDLPSTDGRSTERDGSLTFAPIAEKIYRKKLGLKKVSSWENVPEAIKEWLAEQERYMAVPFQQKALERAVIEADKTGKESGEKLIFDAGWLDSTFTDLCNVSIVDVSYSYNPEAGQLNHVNYADLVVIDGPFNGYRFEKIPFDHLGEEDQETARAMALEVIAQKQQESQPDDIQELSGPFLDIGGTREEFNANRPTFETLQEAGYTPDVAAKLMLTSIRRNIDLAAAKKIVLNGNGRH